VGRGNCKNFWYLFGFCHEDRLPFILGDINRNNALGGRHLRGCRLWDLWLILIVNSSYLSLFTILRNRKPKQSLLFIVVHLLVVVVFEFEGKFLLFLADRVSARQREQLQDLLLLYLVVVELKNGILIECLPLLEVSLDDLPFVSLRGVR
jgi:hypothetical protein